MKKIDNLFIFVLLVSFLGSLINSYTSPLNELEEIGNTEILSYDNISSIEVVNNNAYIYTDNITNPDYVYYIGDKHLFTSLVRNITYNKKINVKFKKDNNIFNLISKNALNFVFLYMVVRSMLLHMKQLNGNVIKQFNSKSEINVGFKDIAGLKEVKEEVHEFVDILKGNENFKKMNCKVPRGALFYGPPGTGKTLIAKAIAKECDTSFFHVSGSSFNEIYVGVGQSRVRSLFKKAREAKPSIIFIDEIDTLGRRRGRNISGHNEHENTLNSLLAEMDGLNDNTDILIFGATNLPEMLDPALLRPGRFDRKIEFSIPNLEERKGIIKLYLKKYPLNGDIDKLSETLASGTYGFSGADLSNLCNEAAIKSVRSNKSKIDEEELNNAIDYVMVGNKRLSSKLSKEEKRTVSYHEAGHAFMSYIQKETESPIKISIIPTTKGALGYSMSLNKEKKLQSKTELLQTMAVMLGGRCSEKVFLKDITTGASNDLEKLRKLAKAYICYYGFNDKLYNLNVSDDDISDKTRQLIDTEIQKLVDNITNYTEKVLKDNSKNIELIKKRLLKNEEINGEEIKALLGKKLENSLSNIKF